jgi:AraC family transcriptional regulator
MASSLKRMQPVLAYAAAHLEDDVSLPALAGQARLSPFHLHRVFSAVAGETPKEFTLRLRLERAAALLLGGRDSVLDIALSAGFQGPEAFCRAFRRRFGTTPSAYRKRGFIDNVDSAAASEHAAFVTRVGPCVRLYRTEEKQGAFNMTYTVEKKVIPPQRVLVVRRRVKRSAIAATIAEVLPKVFVYAQSNGIALEGLPFTRYFEVGPGLLTIEPGMRIASAGGQQVSDGEVTADTLPGGPVATTTHNGAYDQLSDAYAAIQQWIENEKLVAAGAPWECYVNDPGEYPDPKDWKTEVFWPLVS